MKNKNNILYNSHTDLALELFEGMEERVIEDGISMEIKIEKDSMVKETIIKITNKEGEKRLGKPCGCYITIEGEDLSLPDDSYHESVSEILSESLEKLLDPYDHILVAGLGNRNVTADSLGPYVVENLYVTRHLRKEGFITKGKYISTIIPGVMAQTGMETGELLYALIEQFRPEVLLVIDSLCARNVDRLNKTIQISDAGIAPGSGVGNHRKELTEKTMGIKVIAIGVPTVISIPAILKEAVKEESYEAVTSRSYWETMHVTPKNIDEAVKKISYTISEALNRLTQE